MPTSELITQVEVFASFGDPTPRKGQLYISPARILPSLHIFALKNWLKATKMYLILSLVSERTMAVPTGRVTEGFLSQSKFSFPVIPEWAGGHRHSNDPVLCANLMDISKIA